MRQVLGHKGAVAAGALAVALFGFLTPSLAEDTMQNAGFSLPGVTLPSGTDEVRAADGTSCRSAVGGNGAYLDVGVIGKQSTANDNAYYGRVVVPLGSMPKRLNCSALYELEIERLKLELELAKAGLGRTQDAEVDSTETSSLEDQIPVEDTAAETAAPDKTSKKKKAADVVAASVEEPADAEPAARKKPAKKRVGKANWDQDGWSTDGFDAGAG
jgi:hypothetical protein